MTGMLASVMSVEEAKRVLEEGVDIIDLKNPHQGALGALDTDIIIDVVKEIKGKRTCSATIGDIEPDASELFDKIIQLSEADVDIVKVGLFSSEPSSQFIKQIKKAAKQDINLVIVVFAEDYKSIDAYKPLIQTGIKGMMLDTREKTGDNLLKTLNISQLDNFVSYVKASGLLTGLAGSLKYEDIDELLALKPDYLGFRGALCSKGMRINQLDSIKVKKIKSAIPKIKTINYDHSINKDEELMNGTVA